MKTHRKAFGQVVRVQIRSWSRIFHSKPLIFYVLRIQAADLANKQSHANPGRTLNLQPGHGYGADAEMVFGEIEQGQQEGLVVGDDQFTRGER